MKNLLYLLLLLCLATACSVSRLLPRPAEEPTRAQRREAHRIAAFVADHPEMLKKDTVKVTVPFFVPQVQFKTRIVAVHDTVYLRAESNHLDTLLTQLAGSLDSAQRLATNAQVHRLLDNRPVLRDTLCFDTLGVAGKIWLTGRTYQILITRAAVRDTTPARVAVQTLQVCPPAPVVRHAWYDPAGWAWPWWAWLLLGLVGGLVLAFRLRA